MKTESISEQENTLKMKAYRMMKENAGQMETDALIEECRIFQKKKALAAFEVLTEIYGFNSNPNTAGSGDEIVSLDDLRFSDEMIDIGSYSYEMFFQMAESKIFLLEEFNPEKMPVLFVHGFHSCPKKFEETIKRLDRIKFQPVVFYYPSSERIASISARLLNQISSFVKSHNISSMKIISHSMGGLVVRDMLRQADEQGISPLPVSSIMTVATPNYGLKAFSQYQVQQLLIFVYASYGEPLKDIFSGSDFLNTVNNHRPHGVRLVTFTGTAKEYSTTTYSLAAYVIPGDDDGLIAAGQAHLDFAESNFYVYADHSTILTDRQVLLSMNE